MQATKWQLLRRRCRVRSRCSWFFYSAFFRNKTNTRNGNERRQRQRQQRRRGKTLCRQIRLSRLTPIHRLSDPRLLSHSLAKRAHSLTHALTHSLSLSRTAALCLSFYQTRSLNDANSTTLKRTSIATPTTSNRRSLTLALFPAQILVGEHARILGTLAATALLLLRLWLALLVIVVVIVILAARPRFACGQLRLRRLCPRLCPRVPFVRFVCIA